jgi:hypothetical protein
MVLCLTTHPMNENYLKILSLLDYSCRKLYALFLLERTNLFTQHFPKFLSQSAWAFCCIPPYNISHFPIHSVILESSPHSFFATWLFRDFLPPFPPSVPSSHSNQLVYFLFQKLTDPYSWTQFHFAVTSIHHGPINLHL